MHVSTTHVLRKFAQKMAAQNKQANPLASIGSALSDPRVLGGLGGAAAGGLGAYGLARMTQSDEDKENSNTPMLAALLGALAGGAGGVYGGPQLAALLKNKPAEPELKNMPTDTSGYTSYNKTLAANPQHNLPAPAKPPAPTMPLSMAPRGNKPQTAAELTSAYGEEPSGSDMLKVTDGQPDKAQLSAMGLGSR
jgi:hypothetical protein